MRATRRTALVVNSLIVAGGAAAGLLHEDPALWYRVLVVTAIAIIGPILVGAWIVQAISDRYGDRIQGPRKAPAPVRREIFHTVLSMYVVALMAAWPITAHQPGRPTGLVWAVEDMSAHGWPMMLFWFWIGVVAADAWTYWKHRLLHTRALFVFHSEHHSFSDPTCFAGFALSPLEAVLTFWPLLIALHPAAAHFVPVYVTLIGGFVVLNLYLHCGVRSELLERWLPRLMLNTSAHRNPHHSRANVSFGEVSWMWDTLMGTSERAIDAERARARQSQAA